MQRFSELCWPKNPYSNSTKLQLSAFWFFFWLLDVFRPNDFWRFGIWPYVPGPLKRIYLASKNFWHKILLKRHVFSNFSTRLALNYNLFVAQCPKNQNFSIENILIFLFTVFDFCLTTKEDSSSVKVRGFRLSPLDRFSINSKPPQKRDCCCKLGIGNRRPNSRNAFSCT